MVHFLPMGRIGHGQYLSFSAPASFLGPRPRPAHKVQMHSTLTCNTTVSRESVYTCSYGGSCSREAKGAKSLVALAAGLQNWPTRAGSYIDLNRLVRTINHMQRTSSQTTKRDYKPHAGTSSRTIKRTSCLASHRYLTCPEPLPVPGARTDLTMLTALLILIPAGFPVHLVISPHHLQLSSGDYREVYPD